MVKVENLDDLRIIMNKRGVVLVKADETKKKKVIKKLEKDVLSLQTYDINWEDFDTYDTSDDLKELKNYISDTDIFYINAINTNIKERHNIINVLRDHLNDSFPVLVFVDNIKGEYRRFLQVEVED
jgi:hypothetical protein